MAGSMGREWWRRDVVIVPGRLLILLLLLLRHPATSVKHATIRSRDRWTCRRRRRHCLKWPTVVCVSRGIKCAEPIKRPLEGGGHYTTKINCCAPALRSRYRRARPRCCLIGLHRDDRSSAIVQISDVSLSISPGTVLVNGGSLLADF